MTESAVVLSSAARFFPYEEESIPTSTRRSKQAMLYGWEVRGR